MNFSQLKVIELASVLAGPSVGMFFAELGAEVLKIEHPQHPDVTRSWKLPNEDKNSSISAYFSSVNYKKKYLQLDLTQEECKIQLFEQLKTTDILLHNFKKGDDEKFGLTSKQLHASFPRLIIGKISGYGSDSDRVAYDLILQAESGFMSMNGTAESGPVKMPVALIDVLAAHHLKEGLLLALLERVQSNKGKTVSVSLYDAAVSSLVNQASNFLMANFIPPRMGSLHPNIAPYGELFETKDKKTVTFAVGSDIHFQKLMCTLGLENLAKIYLSNQERVRNRVVIAENMQEKIAGWESIELMEKMEDLSIPFGIVKNLEAVFHDKAANELIRKETIDGVITQRVSSIAFRYEK